jgi:hypothetical protein
MAVPPRPVLRRMNLVSFPAATAGMVMTEFLFFILTAMTS